MADTGSRTVADMDESHRGAFGVVNGPAPLTAEEVAELPEGAQVTAIWSGGNGPAEYVVSIYGEDRYVWDGETEQLRFYNPLTFVGGERFHTRVWRGHGLIARDPSQPPADPGSNDEGGYVTNGEPHA